MNLTINYSKILMPFIRLSYNWIVQVKEDRTVILYNKKIPKELAIVYEGIYVNLDKAKSILYNSEFEVLLSVIRTKCMLSRYLTDNNIVKVVEGKYVSLANEYYNIKHIVEGVGLFSKENNPLADWSNIIINSPKPEPQKCKYKRGSLFLIGNSIWVLASNTFVTGTSSLLCIDGDDKGEASEFFTLYINELTPIDVSIEIV